MKVTNANSIKATVDFMRENADALATFAAANGTTADELIAKLEKQHANMTKPRAKVRSKKSIKAENDARAIAPKLTDWTSCSDIAAAFDLSSTSKATSLMQKALTLGLVERDPETKRYRSVNAA